MDLIERTTNFPHEAVYWNKVEQALTDVLDIDPGVAAEIVGELIRKNLEATPQERLLGYHAEPLDVAAQATGRGVGDKERARYLAIIPSVRRQAAVA